MESSSISTSPMKALSFLSTPTQSLTKPNLITLFQFSPKRNLISITRCSTKPDTNTNTNKDSTFGNIDFDSQRPNSPKPNTSDELSSGGLVFDLGVGDSWDSSEVGSPVVKRFLSDEEERWYMWYHGRSNPHDSDSVGLAVSSNGVHWERGLGPVQTSRDVGSVMYCGRDWWAFDTFSIRPSEIVIMSSSKVRALSAVYWMYYTGFTSEEAQIKIGDDFGSLSVNLHNPDGNFGGSNKMVHKSLPGLAISQDGRYWARIEGEHHSGALFDVGSDKEWDSLFIASPQVVFHESGDLRMYYHSFDVGTNKFCVGVARSRDGIRWVKLGKVIGGGQVGNFDEIGAINAHVVKSGNRDGSYLMAYEGVGPNGDTSVGLAYSKDGLRNWVRVQDGPVLWAQNGWDSKGVGSPCLVKMDSEEDEWRLYYRGVGIEGKTGIGMAVSQGSDVTRFTRWSGFHL